ncbi:hypothetical protein EK904_008366 [Melospiza melodia maxima]|nr:hypothetical protein EK904_008366 [Melospiza melodia maxima]
MEQQSGNKLLQGTGETVQGEFQIEMGSPVEEDRDTKIISKDEKGRSASSSGRNFWVSGLASTTRATDLKNLFSKYGKVVGAKVVTNARSPGARCYGFVTMSTAEEATKCITHLHKTELHGKIISVEKAKNEPAGKKTSEKKESEAKRETVSERPGGAKRDEKSDQKDDSKKTEDKDEKEKKDKDDQKSGSSDQSKTIKSGSKGTERTVVMDKSKGEPVISVKTSTTSKDRSVKSQDRKSESRERQGIVPFDKIKAQRKMREAEQRRLAGSPFTAIEEEGGNPDEIPVVSENIMKKTPKRTNKGRRADEEGVEDNGLEEDSGDGQDDIEASLDTLQDIDMMDISVLDEAEIDNGNAVDCGDDYSAHNILDSLSDSKENVDAEVKEFPDQPTEFAVVLLFVGRKPEEEGVEDNGLEENSRDGQEDIEANLDTLQDIDMMDISVLDEAEIDNSSAVDCGEDYSPDNILDSLSDNKDNVEAEMKELPDQLTENEEDYDEIENNLEASSDLIEMKLYEVVAGFVSYSVVGVVVYKENGEATLGARRDDPYWTEAKRMAMNDRYHSDFSRQDRFHDFDHRDRGRYQEHSIDRRDGSRTIMGDRDGQHYPDERHGGPDRHSRDSRESWGSYGSDRRMSESRGIPPQSRDGRDWGDHSRKFEGHQDRSWQSSVDGGMIGRDHERWQGGGRGRPGHVMHRGGMSGRGSFMQGGNQSQIMHGGGMQGEGFAGQERANRPNDPRFNRRY